MRPEGVAQRVRMHVGGEAAQNGDALDDASDATRGQARLARFAEAAQLQVEEERGRLDSLPCRGWEKTWFFMRFCRKTSLSG